jgi:hypothetical protein
MTRDEVNKHNDFPRAFRPEPKFNRNALLPQLGGMPSDRHPIQYVSAQAALYYAAALGCRLPTATEWRQALAASGATAAKGDWNLRDQTWEAFRAYAAEQSIAFEHWPDRGSFPADPAAPPSSLPGNDKVLLYRPAPSADQKFHDLVGNVAEFVLQEPDAFARWRDKKAVLERKEWTAAEVKSFLSNTTDAVAVIGGSAVSAPQVPVDQPLRADRADKGYSDVGLRPAFTAPTQSPAERLKWVLAGEEYVWPRTASAASRAQ